MRRALGPLGYILWALPGSLALVTVIMSPEETKGADPPVTSLLTTVQGAPRVQPRSGMRFRFMRRDSRGKGNEQASKSEGRASSRCDRNVGTVPLRVKSGHYLTLPD